MNLDTVHPGLAEVAQRLSREWPAVEITVKPVGAKFEATVILPQPNGLQIAQRTEQVSSSDLAKWIERIAANIRFTLADQP